jgi:hypothetical protein
MPPPGNVMPPPIEQPPPQERLTFGQWYKKKPLAWVGTGVAGLGLIALAIPFSASASSASSASADHYAQILAENSKYPQYNPTHRTNLCGDADGNGALPHYVQACSVLKTDIDHYHADVGAAAAGWTLFGVGVVGTALYAMIDWYPHRATGATGATGGMGATRSPLAPQIAVMPMVGPTQRGVGFVGTF